MYDLILRRGKSHSVHKLLFNKYYKGRSLEHT